MKNFNQIILALLGIFALTAPVLVEAGQTVQGNIVSNTVWTAEQSPYIIQGKVVIEKGATLTLLPGTRVYFAAAPVEPAEGSSLVVQGGLEALGTQARFVFFSPAVPGDSWGQIYFQESDADHSALKNCVVTGGRVVCNGSSPSIEQCFLTGSKNALVVGPGSTPRIVGNRISGNTIGLTFMDGAAGSVVADNLISDNVYGVCAPNFGEARMAANRVSGNHLSDLLNPEAQIQTVSVQPASDPGVIQLASAQ